jgi:NADPH:quinone reductase-like Zn-dependent oxidoreductase
MSTHAAVVTVAMRAPLQVHQVPTVHPSEGEVRIRVEWTASAPLDLHQADGGLLVNHPQVLGDGIAGTVVAVSSSTKRLKVNDKVFGFTWRSQQEKAHQIYATAPENLLGVLPDGISMQEAATLPNNFVTVFHAVVTDLGLTLPWPKPSAYTPEQAEDPILIWGGSSSVGQYALQILKYFGYRNLLTTASPKHHDLLRSYGAAQVFDYNDPDVIKAILASSTRSAEPAIPLILDCIGSQNGSVRPLALIAQSGAKVAVLLPVIVRDATETEAPEYSFDVPGTADWANGVEAVGVRTHFYLDVNYALTLATIEHCLANLCAVE